VDARLRESAGQMIAFLGRPDVLAAVEDYAMGAEDRVEGERLLAAWERALGTLGGTRAVRGQSTQSDIQAREAFASWLTKWWEIARTELEDRPEVLTALGVQPISPRKGRKAAAKD